MPAGRRPVVPARGLFFIYSDVIVGRFVALVNGVPPGRPKG